MKPFTSKHSIAAGSPLHLGGSGKSPLDQRNVQDISATDTGADIYRLPEVPGPGGSSEAFAVVQDRRPNSKPRYTKEQLAKRVDVKTGKPLGFNRTSGTVETYGGDNPNDLKPYKNVNLDNATSEDPRASSNARSLIAQTSNQLKPTNQEYETNEWSAASKRKFPKATKVLPQPTYSSQSERFDSGRLQDSTRTMRNRNFAATNQELESKNKRLSSTVSEEQLKKFLRSKK